MDRFDLRSGEWQPAAPLATARAAPVVGAGDAVYAIGGFGPKNGTVLSTVERLDAGVGAWQAGPALPEQRGGHCAVAAENAIYVLYGIGSKMDSLGSILRLDLREKKWEPVQVMENRGKKIVPTDPRFPPPSKLRSLKNDLGCALVGDALVVCGGFDMKTGGGFGGCEILDLRTNVWAAGPDMPTGRHSHVCAAFDGQILAAGGAAPDEDYSGSCFMLTGVAGTPSWLPTASLATERKGFGLVAIP